MQTLKYQIGKIVAIVLLIIGSMFSVVLLVGVFGENGGEKGVTNLIVGGIILGVIPLIAGFFLWRGSKNGERKFLLNKYEQQIFKIASQNGGHLTPTELAMKTDLNLKESKKVLETMQLQGYCELKISSQGSIVFYFRELDKGDSYTDSELL